MDHAFDVHRHRNRFGAIPQHPSHYVDKNLYFTFQNDFSIEHAIGGLLGENLKAIHLLEVSLSGDPAHRPSLLVRKDALSSLLAEAKATFQNSYEIEWLNYRIRITDEALAAE